MTSLHIALAVTCVLIGREREAMLKPAEVLRIIQKLSVDYFVGRFSFKDESWRDELANASAGPG
jgi:hypothetical protein